MAAKIKRLADDFFVEEITDLEPTRGPFALYRLKKRGIDTPTAIKIISQELQLSSRDVAFGGMKDRHAVTVQFLTIKNGPRDDFHADSFDLDYLGQTFRPFSHQNNLGNQFEIVVRNLTDAECTQANEELLRIREIGIPNYFDQQRFGSVGFSKQFIAVPLMKNEFETALKLALAEPNPHDRGETINIKETLRTYWGDWVTAKRELPRSSERSVITYLVDHPSDFKKAFALINHEMRGIYLSAFQSFVWNEALVRLLRAYWPAGSLIERTSRVQTLVYPKARLTSVPPKSNTDAIVEAPGSEGASPLPAFPRKLLLPSARMKTEPNNQREHFDAVLEPFGLSLDRMLVRFPRDSFYSKLARDTFIMPMEFQASAPLADDLYPGMKKWRLRFRLPRGAYATMVLRRLGFDHSDETTAEPEQAT